MNSKLTPLALIVASLFAVPTALAQQSTPAQGSTDVGRISVEGQPGGTDTGLIQQEEAPKARSSVSRDYIEKQGPSNPYQLINLLPGVNQGSYDATGLFGGNLRVRGFNSDQMGFTIDGAPVNDSGNFAVYPQEYTDPENLCQIFITQGATDTDAPHVGATGGNVGIVPCAPLDTSRVRALASAGQINYYKAFLRYDTGLINDGAAKAYLSVSESGVEKFKGTGAARNDHVDFRGVGNLSPGNSITAGFLYTDELNNNFRLLSKAQLAQYGNTYDFGNVAPQHAPGVNGTAQNDITYGPNVANQIFNGQSNSFYGFSVNPFRNYLATLKGSFQLASNVHLDVDPYFWYGYGTGGTELTTLKEGTQTIYANIKGGIADINGDGDTRDTAAVYRGSVTQTHRPGVESKINWQLNQNNSIDIGVWYEDAHHRQTAPAVQISNNGTAADVWLDTPSQYLKMANGQSYQNRDWLTESTGQSVFAQDAITLMGGKLNVLVGARETSIERNFHNYANEGSSSFNNIDYNGGADYTIDKTYREFLPSLGVKFALSDQQSVFADVTKNFKAPANFVFGNLVTPNQASGVPQYLNGQEINYHITAPAVSPETAVNSEIGYRFAGDVLSFSGTLFNINYSNRIAAFLDNSGFTGIATNVGSSTTNGMELEAGYKIDRAWSLYGSATYTKSKIDHDTNFQGTGTVFPTAGKEFPDTPNYLAAFGAFYNYGSYFGSLEAKYTGRRYTTLVNDDSVGGYTTVNLNLGYRLPRVAGIKDAEVRLNIYNLLGQNYLLLNGPDGSSYGVSVKPIPGAGFVSTPTFYVGAPRFASVTLRADF